MRAAVSKGFTLIEVLTIMLVVAILASVGIPSMSRMLEGNRLSANTNRLVSSLYAARSEAVKRNIEVVVCTRNVVGTACGDATTNWKDGWIVYVDNTAKELLNVAEKSDASMDFSAVASAGVPRSIRFSGEGMVDVDGNIPFGSPNNDWVNFQLKSDHDDKRIVCLGSVGSIRSCNPNDARQTCKSEEPSCRE